MARSHGRPRRGAEMLPAIPGIAPSAHARAGGLGDTRGRRALAWPPAQSLRAPITMLALAAAYYGAAKVDYALELAGPVAAIIWLPAGVGIAFLALGGLRLWRGVLP